MKIDCNPGIKLKEYELYDYFYPKETSDDFISFVYGVIHLVLTHGKLNDGTPVQLKFKYFNQDHCEHSFADIKLKADHNQLTALTVDRVTASTDLLRSNKVAFKASKTNLSKRNHTQSNDSNEMIIKLIKIQLNPIFHLHH